MSQLATYLENRAIAAISIREKLEKKMAAAKKKGKGNRLSRKLSSARSTEAVAVALTDDVKVLVQWMHEDVLAVAGPDFETRAKLYAYIVEELAQRQPQAAHRIGPVVRTLENGRADLLAFVAHIDEHLDLMAQHFQVAPSWVRQLFETQAIPQTDPRCWQQEERLRQHLGDRFHLIKEAITDLIGATVRASSIVENLNSRLRNYFFLRKQLGPEYLDLLRFFLNHRRFMRSECPEREGRSPAEILAGEEHPHWLELLGFELFKRA